MAEYDHIVVGAGSAGCVLASRLSEDPARRVLLIEAGGDTNRLFVHMPAGNGFLFGNPDYDWGYRSEPQASLGGRRIYYARGKGLGGSSSINGMVYVRANAADYDSWRNRGLAGWGFADLLPYFRKSETSEAGASATRGGEGPLKVGPSRNYNAIDRRFSEACDSLGLPENPDPFGGMQIGHSRLEVTVHRGRRMSTAATYLAQAQGRPNLTILTGARALSLLFEGKRVSGVRVRRADGDRDIHGGEITLALGVFETPKLLMLSGIGPADHLRAHGIRAWIDLPGVGENLVDHVNIPVQFACRDEQLSFARWQRLDRALWLGARYVLTGRGPGAAPFWSACAFTRASGAGAPDDLPDFQTYFTPMVVVEDLFDSRNRGFRRLSLDELGAKFLARGKRAVSGFQFDVNLLQPLSAGTVRLASADPLAPPRIDPRLLSEAREQNLAAEAILWARQLAAQPSLAEVAGPELAPGSSVKSGEELREAARRLANTGNHPLGTCRMGTDTDPLAVVDGALRLRGAENLRIVDASIFPTQIGGNPNAPLIAIAERAADLLRGRLPLAPA